jgi:uracil-DNA glycosylase family 4
MTPSPRPAFCQDCPISRFTQGYVPLTVRQGTTLVVGESPAPEDLSTGEGFSGGSGRWLKNMLGLAGQKWETTSTLNVIGCHPPEGIFPGDKQWKWTSREVAQQGVEYCREHHLQPGLDRAAKSRIYAVGNRALHSLTGHSGIHTWRGSPLPLTGGHRVQVMPIISPAALMRQQKLVSTTVGDLRKSLILPPEHYTLWPSLPDVQKFRATRFAFDFEWNGAGEITLCGLSDRFYHTLVVPFEGEYIGELQRIFESATCLIGHNIIGADLMWIEKLGWHLRDDIQIEDTMLKQHLVQPDLPHGLDFVASVFTNKVFWKGKGWEEMDEEHEGEETSGQQWRTWDKGDALPRTMGGYGGCLNAGEAFRLYNARDTDAEYQINVPLDNLIRKWDLRSLYQNVSRPAAYICRWIGERGLRLDTSRLGELREGIDKKIAALETHLPEGLRPYEETVGCNLPAPEGTLHEKTVVCKGPKGSRHTSVGILFTDAQNQSCPSCGRVVSGGKRTVAKIIKGTKIQRVVPYNSPPKVAAYVQKLGLQEVIDRKTGNKTTGAKARGAWAKDHPEFTLLGSLKEQVTLRNNFAKDSLLGLDRMFFNLKVHGTSEGRLSSSGRRRGVDLNIQNQPEEFRGIYIPDQEGWGFLNGDISQGESWLTCWLAEDWDRWEKLQTPGYDEHAELASEIFGKSVTKSHTKDSYWQKLHPDWTPSKCVAESLAWDALRQVGKKTNHASSYGMGYRTYHQQLITAGWTEYKESDARDFLEAWKRVNKGTVAWQKRTIETMRSQGWLRNPFGRHRWFSSHDSAAQCLAFLPASTLADIVIRMMIAHYPSRFQQELEAERVGIYHDIVEGWHMCIQVHDSIVLQGPWAEGWKEQRERSQRIMSQSWSQLPNPRGGEDFHFNVDFKGGMGSWGDVKGV